MFYDNMITFYVHTFHFNIEDDELVGKYARPCFNFTFACAVSHTPLVLCRQLLA